MRKYIITLALVCACAMSTIAAELYTVWTKSNYTLTFYYDNNRSSRTGDKVELIAANTPYWGSFNHLVETAVLDASMQNYHPTSLKAFFQNYDYSYKLGNLRTITNLEYLDLSKVTNMSYMFAGCSSLQNLTFVNQIYAMDLSHMFSGCTSLEVVNMMHIESFNIHKMGSMFSGCSSLKRFVSNVKPNYCSDFSYMFQGCTSLESLNIADWTIQIEASDVSFYGMFEGCTALTNVYFNQTSFTTAGVKKYASMFNGCSALKWINLNGFYFKDNLDASLMFSGCSNLTTIYCDQDLTSKSFDATYMFLNCTKLKGNNGTTYSSSHVGRDYARPDRGIAQPGYFTTDLEPLPIPCDVPTNIQATDVTATSARLSWSSDADMFYVEVAKDGEAFPNGNWTFVTYKDLTDLIPNTRYKFHLRVKCGDDSYSEWSVIEYFTTLSSEGIDQVIGTPSSVTHKHLRDGMLLIERNGRTFTAQGAEVK